MLKYYITLGVVENSSDADIRKKYLELVQFYTPEKYPEIFSELTKSYEAIKTEEKRILLKIFSQKNVQGLFIEEIKALAFAKPYKTNDKIKLKDIIRRAKND